MRGEAFLLKMKRFLIGISLSVAVASNVSAQFTSNGYYRIRNYGTERYMYITDNTGTYDMNRDVGDFAAIQLWKGEERVISNPSTVMYVEEQSNQQFDISAQGTGIYAMVQRYVDVHTITSGAFKGTYTVSASAYNITKYLCDKEMSAVDRGTVGTGGSSPYRNWEVFMVSPESNDSYFGITPNVQLGEKYYYPFYVSFPFSLYSSGMKAYTVSRLERGYAIMNEVTGLIPAYTPVFIECSSSNPSDNRLNLLVSSNKPLENNLMSGVLFCNNQRPKSADAITAFDSQSMRVLGVTSEGKLGFVTSSPNLVTYSDTQYLPANQAYLPVEQDTEEELTLVTEDEYNEILSNMKYTLTYLVDGKVYTTQKIKVGDQIIPLEPLQKEGYTFSGWSEIPETMPAGDFTVRATFSLNNYTLTYVVDDEVFNTVSVPYGTSIKPVTPPSREGYTFSGWSEIPATMPAHDVQVNGTFSINTYTLTYLVDGEVFDTQTILYGDAVTAIDEPVKEGHLFSGWSEIPATMPATDVTVTGTFSICSYQLIYILNGGAYDNQVYLTSMVTYGAEVTAPESVPAQTGYTFQGWGEMPASMPAHDVVVVGTYSLEAGIVDVRERSERVVYDLSGQRIYTEHLPKGIYIINGKKTIIK